MISVKPEVNNQTFQHAVLHESIHMLDRNTLNKTIDSGFRFMAVGTDFKIEDGEYMAVRDNAKIEQMCNYATKYVSKYAGKSGSTDTDNWMVGYNPNVLMLVWNGYDDNRELAVKDGAISKNIWVDTVENLSIKKSWYEMPDNVIGIPLNSITGEVSEDNNKTSIFYYVNGSEYHNQDTEFVYKEKTTE